jgi:hypothetical protein
MEEEEEKKKKKKKIFFKSGLKSLKKYLAAIQYFKTVV